MGTFASELQVYKDDKAFPVDVAHGWMDKTTLIRLIIWPNENGDNEVYLTIGQAEKLHEALGMAIWRAKR